MRLGSRDSNGILEIDFMGGWLPTPLLPTTPSLSSSPFHPPPQPLPLPPPFSDKLFAAQERKASSSDLVPGTCRQAGSFLEGLHMRSLRSGGEGSSKPLSRPSVGKEAEARQPWRLELGTEGRCLFVFFLCNIRFLGVALAVLKLAL